MNERLSNVMQNSKQPNGIVELNCIKWQLLKVAKFLRASLLA